MLKKLLALVIVLCVVFFLIAKPYYRFLTDTVKISLFNTIFTDGNLRTVDNAVNIVILGIAGGNHDGPNLSDSITVVHYDFKKNKITTIGIPRDVWSSSLEDKINTAYAYGEAKQPGGGVKLAKAEVAGIVGFPIQYAVVISFEKFRTLIDDLGGIDITVEHAFTDHEFPITGKENDTCGGDPDYKCRYETITFEKGPTHMNGTTALKFVRSRHAQGSEGSDFARSRRQQLVMNAVKNTVIKKLLSFRIQTIQELYTAIDTHIERDIQNQQIAIIAKNVVLKRSLKQSSFSLTEDLFEVPNEDEYYGKYVLIPRNKDWVKIHSYITCLLSSDNAEACK